MKLVLLPGMDGTGELFSSLLFSLSEYECEVIALPQTGPQDYASITEYVKKKLPQNDFILVAESFSGPAAARLAKEGVEHLQGVIFVATFLSKPHWLLLSIARALPLKLLSALPFAKPFVKALFLGSAASNELVEQFQSIVDSLPSQVIKARLSSMLSLSFSAELIELPVGYIQATSDYLVSSNKVTEFSACFRELQVRSVEGPHFILQANPTKSAEVISELVALFGKQTGKKEGVTF